ncbi:hypothetical protein FRC04_004457 [Tulasnella sp. 424]|nr:hypothetical protein FRC04_004457 [Tulasnella sp. 424]
MPRHNRITDTVALVPSPVDTQSSALIVHGASPADPSERHSWPSLSLPRSVSAITGFVTRILRRDQRPMLAPAMPSLVGNGYPDPTTTCLREDAQFTATTPSPAATRTPSDPVAQVPKRGD